MTAFIRPQFTQTVTYEAILVRAEVEAYAKENNIAFDEAVEVMGRDYVAKYGKYIISGGSGLVMTATDR